MNLKLLFKTLLIVSTLQWANLVHASPTFGAEFTFTNDALRKAQKGPLIVDTPEVVQSQKLMVEKVREACSVCRVLPIKNAYGVITYKVIFPDDWYFVISTDPAVIEIQTKPSTTSEYSMHRNVMQKYIFDMAHSVGLTPHDHEGGGHIHMGFNSAMNGDQLLFRNFVVDFVNHPELRRILGDGYGNPNAPSVSELPNPSKEAFRKIISDFDQGLIKSEKELCQRIESEVYTWNSRGWGPPQKYQSLNLTRIADENWKDNEKTIEIRSLAPQQSADEFIALIKLFEGRLEYLKTKQTPKKLNLSIEGPQEKVRIHFASDFQRLSQYMQESGTDPQKFFSAFKLRDSIALYTLGLHSQTPRETIDLLVQYGIEGSGNKDSIALRLFDSAHQLPKKNINSWRLFMFMLDKEDPSSPIYEKIGHLIETGDPRGLILNSHIKEISKMETRQFVIEKLLLNPNKYGRENYFDLKIGQLILEALPANAKRASALKRWLEIRKPTLEKLQSLEWYELDNVESKYLLKYVEMNSPKKSPELNGRISCESLF